MRMVNSAVLSVYTKCSFPKMTLFADVGLLDMRCIFLDYTCTCIIFLFNRGKVWALAWTLKILNSIFSKLYEYEYEYDGLTFLV